MRINLNADVGEGYGRYTLGDDAALLRVVGSANIACGMHAGDPQIMAATVQQALRERVSVGAHPGFDDLRGFGRRPLPTRGAELESLVLYQVGALQALARAQGGRVTHVKPHGALNNLAHDQADVAQALARAVRAADPELIFVATACSAMVAAAEAEGLRVAHEAYVDRRCDDQGRLLPRSDPRAVIRDPATAAAEVLRLLDGQGLVLPGGRRRATRIDTLCVHGDEPTALAVALHVRTTLQATGVELVTLPDLLSG